MTDPEIQLLRYAIALLEQIAYNGMHGNLEKDDYLARLQKTCGCQEGTEQIFTGLAPKVEVKPVRPGQKDR